MLFQTRVSCVAVPGSRVTRVTPPLYNDCAIRSMCDQGSAIVTMPASTVSRWAHIRARRPKADGALPAWRSRGDVSRSESTTRAQMAGQLRSSIGPCLTMSVDLDGGQKLAQTGVTDRVDDSA